jgi:protein-tyrosine-phosphatase
VLAIKLLYPDLTQAEADDIVLPHGMDTPGRRRNSDVTDKPVVLFLYVHNAGRSLAARVLLDHYAKGRIGVESAGSEPGDLLNPSVVAVLQERGLDPSREFPKPLTDEAARMADVIVTMGCGDTCPVYPGRRYLDWELDDPAGKSVDQVRPIVGEIDRRVQGLLAELIPLPPTSRSARVD